MSLRLPRRDFITGLGGAAAWPLAARAQQPGRMRRIGVLMVAAADDPRSPEIIAAFLQGMAELGWTDRRNMVIDQRWAAGEAERMENLRQSWSNSRRMSSWLPASHRRLHCNGRPVRYRSCSWMPAIPLEVAWLQAWRGRAAISLALLYSSTASVRSG